MSTTDIKTELRRMIEEETDISILEAIRTILQKAALNPELKQKLTARASQSEHDIAAGHLYTKEEVIERTTRK
jgi:hypothetical protein